MGDDEEDLRLNTIDRFRKRSLKLVLEEHGHCEVPAGCGGVVLRWTDPAGGIPVRLWLFAGEGSVLRIDGEPTTSSRPVLGYGMHALTLEVEPPFMFAAADDEMREGHRRYGTPEMDRILLLSEHGRNWQYAEGDAWHPLVRAPIAEPEQYTRGALVYSELKDMGAEALGPRRGGGRIRVRCSFEVRRPR
jgi:hypothetical protein